MKYGEAEKQIKALSSEYDINMVDGDFNVLYNDNGGKHGIYISGYCEYDLCVGNVRTFSAMPFSNKLYMILAELASTPLDERVEKNKYFIHVFKGNKGYLNLMIQTNETRLDNSLEMYDVKTKFTDKEIEQLKQRDDIPLDWNKVKFEEVEDD